MGQVGISKKHELKIFDLPKSSLLVYTVEPHYFELGSFEVPAISNLFSFPLDFEIAGFDCSWCGDNKHCYAPMTPMYCKKKSSECNGAYISLPVCTSRQSFSKGAFFWMPANPII